MPTKVLYVSEAPIYGGAERYLITLAEGTDREQFDLEMVISDQAPDQLREALDRLNIPAIEIPPIAGKKDLKGLLRHVACFKARHPQIVHFNLSNPLHGQYAMLAARLAKVPAKIATLHLPPRNTTPTWRGRFFERQTICKLDTFIAVCRASRDLAIEHFGLAPDRTASVYNGIDVAEFDTAVANLDPVVLKKENEILLGTVGRLSPQKGYDVLLDSLPEVIANVPNLRLAIAGEGPEEKNLRAQCKKLNIENHVDFLGMRADVPAVLHAFDLFVLPSRYESFPISILEVMAAGKAIVTTQVDGIPESVDHGITGLLVPPEDPKSLSVALLALLQDPSRREEMGLAGRKRVETDFTLHKTAYNTQAIYERFCL